MFDDTRLDDPDALAAADPVPRSLAEADHLDVLTVTHPDWWFNVRPSNTEPLLRLNAEGKDVATMERVRDEVLAVIREDHSRRGA